MRNRSNSGVRLDYYQRLVHRTILKHQNPATGLFPATAENSHAWVRDNLYSVLAVWGLGLAYRKNADLDEDRAKAYELEQSVVKNMRGLLFCMMMQTDKLESFKKTQNPHSCFHAKYSSKTGRTVVGDYDWGHLQIDATSMFVLFLAQMTASGLRIVYTLDEVSFVQNLVFYIEKAYRTPDYGIWERGDKTNHGLPELNSSSIGMAKAALEAINELDLFGARGGPASVIHVLPDEAHQCQAILQSMLPRESSSKEIDASLLGVISFPAFAVNDPDLIDLTRKTVQDKLQGAYGCSRFLRDGYKTCLEDPSRQYYEPGELAVFENIECEWPLFFTYFVLDGIFRRDKEQTSEYMEALEELMVKSDSASPLVPELYRVPKNKVELEKKKPGSQKREPIGQVPHKWSQSLYVVSKLLHEGFLSPGEIDPLNRRLNSEPRPDVVVQVVILAESTTIQGILMDHDIHVQTINDVAPIQVYPSRALSQLYAYLGKNKKLGLTGRPSNEVGLLATSKLYTIDDQLFAFMPQYVDQNQFFLPLDTDFFLDTFKTNTDFLCSNWNMLGRPTMIFPALMSMLDQKQNLHPALIATIKKLQTGYISGTRIQLGNLSDFKTTSCITNLDFIRGHEDYDQGVGAHQVINLIDGTLSPTCPRPRLQTHTKKSRYRRMSGRSASVSGLVKRTRSIQIDPAQAAGESQPVSPNSSISSGGLQSPPVELHLSHLRPGSAPRFPVSPVGSPASSPKLHHKPFAPAVADSELPFNRADYRELVDSLEKTESLHEQADILHFLFMNKGLDWDTEIGGKAGCTVQDLLVELYEKAGYWKQWWLVRHTAGMLRKRVEDLSLAAADLLVRQKQLSVGLPPEPREKIITSPLPPDELADIIFDAYGEDVSTATLTQEILIYLAMFVRTEPKLFNEMLRLRVGLIIQVMASELARTLKCSGDEASDHLLNLSPFEMKTLLHHILSGKEFRLLNEDENGDEYRLSVRACDQIRNEDNLSNKLSSSYKVIPTDGSLPATPHVVEDDGLDEETEDKQGQWLRRRRLDGSLNRTPVGFYQGIWTVLQRCPVLNIEGHSLNQALTREMTPGELKFALQVEMVLNRIPQPEYRQLNVEALMVVVLMVENDNNNKLKLPSLIAIDRLVHEANALFLQDQKMPADVARSYEGAAGICLHFYDSAPSGRYGTLSYLCRALVRQLNLPMSHEDSLECVVS